MKNDYAYPSVHDPKTGVMQLGMKLRDFYAAQAMIGLLLGGSNCYDEMAKRCFQIADEMLRAREL